MKRISILLFVFAASTTYGQAPAKDSTVRVIYANNLHKGQEPAWYINGKFIGGGGLATLSPDMIDNINILKDDVQIDNIKYHGQIHIQTKSSYDPKLITLTELKDKYTNLKDKSVVFMIDGKIIHADYTRYVVDENYLLQIVVDKINNPKENIDLGLINILTKTEENIKRSKQIILRGAPVAMNP